MKVRQTVDNPDSQFVAMPQTITPAGIELNPQTEPIEDPNTILDNPQNLDTDHIYETVENVNDTIKSSSKNEN